MLDKLKSNTVERAFAMLASCQLCPRRCGVNRLKGEIGYCKTGLLAKVCSFMAHHGEEPPVSGERGSGTIFFSGCNMSCVYCQNHSFSQGGEGREVSFEELASFMIELQNTGCHNINLVTPTHVMPQILKSLEIAKVKGLNIPLVYNTSGYELPEIIGMLTGIIDVYLADMRYHDEALSEKYSHAPKYPEYNRLCLKEMHKQVGAAQFDKDGIIKKGLIIRHLVLPNNISGTEEIMKFISREISSDTFISLMSQYTPYYKAEKFQELSRRISADEYESAKKSMESYGLFNGWTQDSGGLERFAGVNIKSI